MTDKEVMHQALVALLHMCRTTTATKEYNAEYIQKIIENLRHQLEPPKPKTRKVKLLGWYNTDARRLEWLASGVTPYIAYKRVPSEDKEIEIEE